MVVTASENQYNIQQKGNYIDIVICEIIINVCFVFLEIKIYKSTVGVCVFFKHKFTVKKTYAAVVSNNSQSLQTLYISSTVEKKLERKKKPTQKQRKKNQ